MQRRTTSSTFASSGPAVATAARHCVRPAFDHVVRLSVGLGLGLLAALVLAVSAHADECPNAAYRTGPSAPLPDCRAYEQVTPPYKATGYSQLFGISPDGSSLVMDISQGLPDLEGFPNVIALYPGALYATKREAGGWTTAAEEPPDSEYIPFKLSPFGDTAGAGYSNPHMVWAARPKGEPQGTVDFITRAADGSLADIGPALSPGIVAADPEAVNSKVNLLLSEGVSSDGSHLLFSLGSDYWPFDATEAGRSLYEYNGVGNGSPSLVAVNDQGSLIGRCGASLGTGDVGQNAIADQGGSVFFTVNKQAGNCLGPPVNEVFARIDNGLPDARTVAISEPSKEDCAACDTEAGALADATFDGASEDGSKVFFSTTQPLLGGSDTSANIYEYDFDAPAGARIVHVSEGDATVAERTAEVLTSNGCECAISEDGSHVYFLAHGVLTRSPDAGGEIAEAGGDNLYVFERDGSYPDGHIAFVARLLSADLTVGWPSGAAETTPDGRFLVFLSYRDLTPDDTSTAQQVFEYDAQTGALLRVSKGQDGFHQDGNVALRTDKFGFALNDPVIPTPNPKGVELAEYSSRLAVSADGSYVFFQSPVGLTPQALGEKQIGESEAGIPYLANNVYEYHAGIVSLISDGQDISSSNSSIVRLISTDQSGGDVFFTTADQLGANDADSNLDIYDARIDGGFPAPERPPACDGEACQGPLAGAPTLLSPGSEFQVGGNPPLAAEPTIKAKAGKPKAKAKKSPRNPKRKRRRSRGARSGHKAGKSRRSPAGAAAREGGRR